MARIVVVTPVHPTESPAKVKIACLNLFPDLAFEDGEDGVTGTGADLSRFRELVRNQQIRDTARDVLIRNRRGDETSFLLSKQAAYVARVNFASRAPLGEIRVTVRDEDLDAVIDDVAESTVGRRLKDPQTRNGGR